MAGERAEALLVATSGSSSRVSMDTASPISSHGQSTTIATGTVSARCLMLSNTQHTVHGCTQMVPGCTCSHIVHGCSSQISRWSHRHRVMHRAVCNVCLVTSRLPTREQNPCAARAGRGPMSTRQQSSSARVYRVEVDGALVSPYPQPARLLSSGPPVRALAAAPLPQHQAERSMEDSSDELSQSSASSTGGRSGAASSPSSIGKGRRADNRNTAPRNHPYPARFEWKSKHDRRLGELAKEHGLCEWAKIAQIFTDEGHGERTGKQCKER